MLSSLQKYRVLSVLPLVVVFSVLSFKKQNAYWSVKEKIYLHTNKPYYSQGDTIWFKAYLTLNDRPISSSVSGTCYVDLITDKNLIDTTLKLRTKGGLASGYIALGDLRKEGIYRLRAYTNYMRQNFVDYTLDRAIIVGDGFNMKVLDGDVKPVIKVTQNDSNLLALKISSSKQRYKPRELVELDISALSAIGNNPIAGNFSISVVDEDLVPYSDSGEANIVTALHPYRDIRDFISSKITEYNNEPGITISGMVKSLTGEPTANGKVSLLSLNGGILEEVKTNADGKFKFEDLLLYGDIDFMLQARTKDGSKKVEVIMDKAPVTSYVEKRKLSLVPAETGIEPEKMIEIKKKQDKARNGGLSRTQRLKEVKIRARRREDPRYATQGGLRIPEGHSDQTYIIDRPESCATLGTCLQGRLQGIIFVEREYKDILYTSYPAISNPQGKPTPRNAEQFVDENTKQVYLPAHVILDGRKLDIYEVGDLFSNNTLDAMDIAKIEVIRTNPALASMLDGPTILIYTKSNKEKFRKTAPNIAYFNIKGMQPNRAFKFPNSSTLYWNPSLQTDETGSAKVQFYAAEGEGSYRVTIEGMAKDGKLASQVYRFNVSRK